MIEHIKGHARFAITGATISVNFQPGDGITAVVGPNGVGKTFTAIESLRYLMFGSKALRSTLSTYQELDLSGIIRIHGRGYVLERSLKAAKVWDEAGETLATGQEEVTKKVSELLGYSMEVFDLCNASVQGETQSFGQLTPGKRKEKIDEVLRVTDVRAVEKACRDEANMLKREAEAMTRLLPALGDAPVKPKDYVPSSQLETRIQTARALRRAHDALTAQLNRVSLPDEPTEPRPDEDALAAAERLAAQRSDLERGARSGPASEPLTGEQIDAAAARYDWEDQRDRRGPEPTTELADVEAQLKIVAQIETIQSMPDIEAHCPKCDHEFRTRPDMPTPPALGKVELLQQRQRHEAWKDPLPVEPTDEHGSLSPRNAEQARNERTAWEDAREAEKQLAALPEPKLDVSATQQALADWRAYDAAVEKKRAKDVDNAMINRQIADMDIPEDTDQLSQQLVEAKGYENDLAAYERDKERHDELIAEITDKQKQAGDFLDGNKELSEARAELKAFLAPALSREASELIRDMSNNVFSGLILDEDMNITVDGQPLETLSGAGKTVANIALRICLTKVLTGSAFPVFLGDEMDGDLDAKRREATTQAMVSLKRHLKQIILITHKDVDIADHVIDLGEITA